MIQKELSRHLIATIDATTERGGRVTRVTSQGEIEGYAMALVGDMVTYADGSEATITDGAGSVAKWGDISVAIVGSRLSNGDQIISTPQRIVYVHVPERSHASEQSHA